MDQGPQSETAPVYFTDDPGVFIIECYKCVRKYEIHGRESILAICLTDEGWVRDGNKMVCPHCVAPRELPVYNRARELTRKRKREAC